MGLRLRFPATALRVRAFAAAAPTYTPKPWTVVRRGNLMLSIEAPHKRVARIHSDDYTMSSEQMEPNAALISAAPDLLEAAEALHAAFEKRWIRSGANQAEETASQMYRDAVAKAKGKR